MGSIWLTDLLDVVSDAGLRVREWPGWTTRARSSGGYDAVYGIFCHHTASSAAPDADCRYMWETCPDGPVGAMLLDRTGLVTVGAAGATNTQGKGGPWKLSRGTIPLDKGNAFGVAIEAANNGTGEPWPTAQQDAYVMLVAALCDDLELDPARDVLSHFEWCEPSCPGRKIDPAGPSAWASGSARWDMDAFRDDVAMWQDGTPPEPEPGPGPDPPIEEEQEDDHMLGLVRLDTNPNAVYVTDGVNARKVRSDEMDELTSNLTYDTGFRYHDLTVAGRPQIRDVNKIPKRPDDQIQLWGIETSESVEQP